MYVKYMSLQEEDEKQRINQAKEAGEDDSTEHAEAAEDSLLGLSIEEVPKNTPLKHRQVGESGAHPGTFCFLLN